MADLIPVLSKEEIEAAVANLAKKISADYKNRELVLVGVLKGAFVFLADLCRQLTIEVKVDFVRLASYGKKRSSSGEVRLTKELEIDIKSKDVLIVEDIIDTGFSLTFLVDYLNAFKPRTVRICTMIDKRQRRETDIRIDYAAHVVDEGFLVGYGLDYAEAYRNLPAVYDLKL
jgi:hypoxanthine phosphoribosyltransferase